METAVQTSAAWMHGTYCNLLMGTTLHAPPKSLRDINSMSHAIEKRSLINA
jgi:hypothetical protein